MEEEYALEMTDITKTFPGVKALDSVSIKVRPGSVHALMGENGAGKSTLMKCLFGIYKPDAGQIMIHGKECHFSGTKDAMEAGVSMIHQELSNVPERTVAQNLWLGREPMNRYHLIDHQKMIKDSLAELKKVHFAFNPNAKMSRLSISQQQGCEIAKAVSYNSTIVVMDEPTSSLTENEVDHLFTIIKTLKEQNVAVVYITHKMDEVFKISDEVSIMRDGHLIGTYDSDQIESEQLIKLMVGRDITQRFPPVESKIGEVVLKVDHITSTNPKSFKDVSFELRRGEILGFSGLVGAQRTEVMEAIFGIRKIASGSITIGTQTFTKITPEEAITAGIGMITEDRRGSGIIPLMNITDNTTIASLKNYKTKIGLLDHPKLNKLAKQYNDELNTKTPSMNTRIMFLSGGNQQKVIVSRWLMTQPDILIMDEPTRGIDVGAKFEIYTIMANLVKQGKAILMVSSEMPELIGMCEKINVMSSGHLTGTVTGEEKTQENIMRLAAQYH